MAIEAQDWLTLFSPLLRNLVGHAFEGEVSAVGIGVEVEGVRGVDAEGGGGGDGVLVGGEEDEFPALRPLFDDEVGDVLLGVFAAAVFMAVGEDGEDDVAGLLVVRTGGEGVGHFGQGAADGIQQGGAAPREEGAFREFWDVSEGDGFDGDLVLVIEQDEGEAGGVAAGLAALGGKEGVEAADGVAGDGLHGARAVEEDGDFGDGSGRRGSGSNGWVHGGGGVGESFRGWLAGGRAGI